MPAFDQDLRIAREAARIARDIGDARHGRCRQLYDLFLGARARRIEQHGAEAVELGGRERSPIEVAMLDQDCASDSPCHALEREHRVAGGFPRIDLAPFRQCQREGAEP